MDLIQADFNAWEQMHPDDAIAGDRGQPSGCIVANWLNDQPGVCHANVGGTTLAYDLEVEGRITRERVEAIPRWVRAAVIRFDSIEVAEPFGPVTFGQFRSGQAHQDIIDRFLPVNA